MFHPFGSFCDGIVVIPDRLLERQACSSLCCSQQYAGSLSWCSFEAAKFHQRVKKFMGQGYEPIPGWGFQHLSYRLKRFILVLDDDDDDYYCYNCYYYSSYNILLLPAINKPGGLKPPTEIWYFLWHYGNDAPATWEDAWYGGFRSHGGTPNHPSHERPFSYWNPWSWGFPYDLRTPHMIPYESICIWMIRCERTPSISSVEAPAIHSKDSRFSRYFHPQVVYSKHFFHVLDTIHLDYIISYQSYNIFQSSAFTEESRIYSCNVAM